jgi:hypothetical protein
MPDDETIIEALLRELAAYEAMGDEVNAQGVRAQLKWKGWKPAAPAKRAEKESPAKETR